MENNNSSGIGICGVLGIVFIVLKLVGVISWSWWWVLAPIWTPVSLAVLILIVIGLKILFDLWRGIDDE